MKYVVLVTRIIVGLAFVLLSNMLHPWMPQPSMSVSRRPI